MNKNLVLILLICSVFTFSGCNTKSKKNKSESITLDIEKNYPTKEINIYDIADIEYISLETKLDFLTRGLISYNDDELIITAERNGDILFFNRKGTGLRKFNHKGHGPNEYPNFWIRVLYDKSKDEVYVNSPLVRKFFVYNSDGVFCRSFSYFDKNLIFTDFALSGNYILCCSNRITNKNNTFFLVSKTDGKLISEIPFSINHKVYNYKLTFIDLGNNKMAANPESFFDYKPLYESGFGTVLNELASDTIFLLNNENRKIAKVIRKPGINPKSQNDVLVSEMITKKYHFLHSYNLEISEENKGKYFGIDQISGEIFEPFFYNNIDYTYKKKISIDGIITNGMSIVPRLPIDLIQDFKKGELKGKLLEITKKLKEDDNIVLRIITFKD